MGCQVSSDLATLSAWPPPEVAPLLSPPRMLQWSWPRVRTLGPLSARKVSVAWRVFLPLGNKWRTLAGLSAELLAGSGAADRPRTGRRSRRSSYGGGSVGAELSGGGAGCGWPGWIKGTRGLLEQRARRSVASPCRWQRARCHLLRIRAVTGRNRSALQRRTDGSRQLVERGVCFEFLLGSLGMLIC